MKVAVVTDDGVTVSPHFGMARHYLVYELVGGSVKGKESRDKAGHVLGGGHGHAQEMATHNTMLSNVSDCQVVIARGMGRPMYEAIRSSGKEAFITRIQSADDAVKSLAEGSLDNHTELLH